MVSLAIGLILMGGMVQIMSTNKNAYRYNTSLAEMQDNGNYALEFVTNQIGQIGFVPDWSGYIDGDNNGDTYRDRRDLESWYYGAIPPVTGKEGGGAVSDSVTISVFADPNDATPIDCVGAAVGAGSFSSPPGARPATMPAFAGITNTLVASVDKKTNRAALTCNGVEVAEGIENMQIVYGVDTPDPDVLPAFAYDGRVDSYLKFDEIQPADLMNIITVRIALLVASSEQSRVAENTNSYDLLGTTITAKGDRKQRNVYTTTIRLRNRCAKFTGSALCA